MTIKNSESGTIVLDLIQMIHDNAAYLSDIDGKSATAITGSAT
jgi:hypothetical protein